MDDETNPSGATMLSRQLKVRQMVLEALKEYPQGRGDDMLLWLYIVRRHYWRVARVSTRDGLSITCSKFGDYMMLPSMETCRRRRQEFQAKYEDLRPTPRVRRKRARLEEAMREDLGHFKGRPTMLNDWQV